MKNRIFSTLFAVFLTLGHTPALLSTTSVHTQHTQDESSESVEVPRKRTVAEHSFDAALSSVACVALILLLFCWIADSSKKQYNAIDTSTDDEHKASSCDEPVKKSA